MSRKTSLNIPYVFCAGLALAAIVVSLGAQSATAAGADHGRLGKPLPHRHHFYAMYRGPSLRRPRPCLTRRNTAFFAGCRRTRSEGRVIHSCRASVFSASHATCRRAHAQTSIVMFNDTHGRVVFR